MFVFALTNPGSERALKIEAAMARPGWHSGYQRRSFVTFKASEEPDWESLDVNLAFARRLCISLGRAESLEAAEALICQDRRAPSGIRIHHARFEDHAMRGVADSRVDELSIAEIIGTVVELSPGECWAGLHRHQPYLSPDPAGDSGLQMPSDSPSRAWLKLEEAVRFFDLDFSARDLVVELGCAPGGVVLALLRRGVPVIGVDPAGMAEIVKVDAVPTRDAVPSGRPWFLHIRKPAALVAKRELAGVTWFMSDMNQSPEVILSECVRFCKMAPSIRHVLVTLKLTDLTEIQRKDAWLETLRSLGFHTIRLQQFSSHHRELALLAAR